ncbi:hypothetical protein PBI_KEZIACHARLES14_75 [Mycobacterium phage Keziacharles14]|nr:hypothetical protein PBI_KEZIACHARLES14_75 [Mycobacterium phage Keziacharles14]
MYVEDVDDLQELEALHAEAVDRLGANPRSEQAAWDIEDIVQRVNEVKAQVKESIER